MGYPIDLASFIWPDADQGRQPQTGPVQADWANPITRGLAAIGMGGRPNEIISGLAASQVSAVAVQQAGPAGIGRSFNGTNATSTSDVYLNVTAGSGGNTPMTLLVLAVQRTSSTAVYGIVGDQLSNGILIKPNSSNLHRLVVFSGGQQNIVGGNITLGVPHLTVGTVDGTTASLYVDGVLQASAACGYPTAWTPNFAVGFCGNSPYDGTVYLWAVFTRCLNAIEVAALNANPWQLVRMSLPLMMPTQMGGGSVVNLAAAAVATASGTANLSRSVSLAAAALGVASGSAGLALSVSLAAAATATAASSAALDHSVPLAAAGTAVSTSSAGLLLTISLAAGALAQASGTAGLALTKALAAAATDQASATADLSTTGGSTVNLAANAQAVASGGATLSLAINLGAAAVAQAFATADLTDAKQLAAAAIAQAQATAALSVGKGLAAAGQAQASGGATIWLQVPLSAAALAQASGAGALALTINLGAHAFSQAGGSASFATPVTLSAYGHSVATAVATLSITPVFATWTKARRVADQARNLAATDCSRTFAVDDWSRNFAVADEAVS